MKNGELHNEDATTAEWSARTVLTNAGRPIAFSRDSATLLTLASEADAAILEEGFRRPSPSRPSPFIVEQVLIKLWLNP